MLRRHRGVRLTVKWGKGSLEVSLTPWQVGGEATRVAS